MNFYVASLENILIITSDLQMKLLTKNFHRLLLALIS